MSIVEALKYTGKLLGTAASKAAVEVGEVQAQLAQARTDLKSKRDNLSAAVAEQAKLLSRKEGARNEKSGAFFGQQLALVEKAIEKLKPDVERLTARVAALSKKDDALQAKWAKLAHDADGMNDEAARLVEGGLV